MIVFDAELRYVVWNPFMQRVMGVPANDLAGRTGVLALDSDRVATLLEEACVVDDPAGDRLPSLGRLVSLYSKASLTPSETAEATQLLASLRANAAVKKWADLSLNNPARCSDLEAIAKNAPMASEEQAHALAPIATKILNQCATSNGLVPGVWAGLFQDDALSSVLLDDEVLPRSSSTVLGILGLNLAKPHAF